MILQFRVRISDHWSVQRGPRSGPLGGLTRSDFLRQKCRLNLIYNSSSWKSSSFKAQLTFRTLFFFNSWKIEILIINNLHACSSASADTTTSCKSVKETEPCFQGCFITKDSRKLISFDFIDLFNPPHNPSLIFEFSSEPNILDGMSTNWSFRQEKWKIRRKD